MSEDLKSNRLETPFKLSQTLQQYGPEHPVDGLTKFELYGFDKPTVDSNHKLDSQTLPTSKAVKMLVNSGDELTNYAKVFLRHFGLDLGVYDSRTNPTGIFKESHVKDRQRGRETIVKYAILRLLGVKKGDTHRSFGCSSVDEQVFSEPFKNAITRIESERRLFPLLNPEQFPRVQDSLNKIISLGLGITPENIFNKGDVPLAFHWMRSTPRLDPLTLPEALSMLLMALKGETNMSEIARQHGNKNMYAVQALLGESERSPLTPFIRKLLIDVRDKHTQQSSRSPKEKKGPSVKDTRKMRRNW